MQFDYFDRAITEICNASDTLRTSTVISDLVEIISQYNKVVFFGVGKSYHASTLIVKIANSYGLKWYAIDAGQALHGDIGMITPRDLLIFISKSGETEEILKVAHYLESNTAICFTFNPDSTLQDHCDHNFHLPPVDECAPYEQAPLVSTILTTMVFYEVIAQLAQQVSSAAFYSSAHPAGDIGRKMRGINDV